MRRLCFFIIALMVFSGGMGIAPQRSFATLKKVVVGTPHIMQHGYAKFNNEDEGFTPDIVVVTGGTFYPFINAVIGDESEGITFGIDSINGDFLEVSQSYDGHFFAVFGISSATTGGSEILHCALFVNNVKSSIQFERKMGGGGDVGDAGKPGILDLDGGDKITLQCTTDGSGKTINVKHVAWTLLRLGD